MATRWGICSAGKISHDFVVALKSLPESEHQVVAVGTRQSSESAVGFARTHSIPRAYGSYQELAKDKEVDLKGCKRTVHRTDLCSKFNAHRPVMYYSCNSCIVVN